MVFVRGTRHPVSPGQIQRHPSWSCRKSYTAHRVPLRAFFLLPPSSPARMRTLGNVFTTKVSGSIFFVTSPNRCVSFPHPMKINAFDVFGGNSFSLMIGNVAPDMMRMCSCNSVAAIFWLSIGRPFVTIRAIGLPSLTSVTTGREETGFFVFFVLDDREDAGRFFTIGFI